MASKPKKIIIVEDEKPLSHALELKLARLGHKVTVAYNGREGLDLLLKEDFDIVLLDLMMPVINGFDVLEKLKKNNKNPTVYVLSNLSQPEDEERAMALGAKKFFIKSDTPLSQIVDEISAD